MITHITESVDHDMSDTSHLEFTALWDVKYPVSIPLLAYESHCEFVADCVSLQREAYIIVDRNINHAIWSDGKRIIENVGYIQQNVIPHIMDNFLAELSKLCDNEKWLAHCSLLLKIQLRTCVITFFDIMHQWNVKGDYNSLKRVLHETVDKYLGFPDCCWGWSGSGILQTILQRNFVYMSPTTNDLTSKFAIPIMMLAFFMGTHKRLGEHSRVSGFVDDIMILISHFYYRDITAIRYCGGWIGKECQQFRF